MALTVRQSDLKLWMACPLKYRYTHVDGLPRQQSGALTFGTIIHECVRWMEENQDLDGAIQRFQSWWAEPESLDPSLTIEYFNRGSSWAKYSKEGPRILTDWWSVVQWDTDLVLAREHQFTVPIGDHFLTGTADKVIIRYSGLADSRALVISDYKTNRKEPTYGDLEDDLQFTAYCYATTVSEFWTRIQDGPAWFERLKDLPREAEWVQLTGPKRKSAGVRNQTHYNRLRLAVGEMARSVEAGIFVPTLSGDSCRWCEFRTNCGLRDIEN